MTSWDHYTVLDTADTSMEPAQAVGSKPGRRPVCASYSPAAFIKFFGQRRAAEQLESYIKQVCNGAGNALRVATKNAASREEWRTHFWVKSIANGKLLMDEFSINKLLISI